METPNLDNVAKRAAYIVAEFNKTAGVTTASDLARTALTAATILGSLGAGYAVGNKFPAEAPTLDTTLPEYGWLQDEVNDAKVDIANGYVPANVDALLDNASEYYNAAKKVNTNKLSLLAASAAGGTLGAVGGAFLGKRYGVDPLRAAGDVAKVLGVGGLAYGALGGALSKARHKNNPLQAPALAWLVDTMRTNPEIGRKYLVDSYLSGGMSVNQRQMLMRLLTPGSNL